MLYAEVYKDKEISKLLFHENPYLNAWMALEEKSGTEIRIVARLLEDKKPPPKIKKLWSLEDMF